MVHGEFDVIAGELKYWGIAVLVFLAISGLAYLVVASMYGGKYIVSFTMDEKGITHEQIPVQKTKIRKLGDIVSGAGAAGANIGRIQTSPGYAGSRLTVFGTQSSSRSHSP